MPDQLATANGNADASEVAVQDESTYAGDEIPLEVHDIIEQHKEVRGALISILEKIQARYGYLPAIALRTVAEETGRSLVDVYRVATFYRAFSLKPRGKHVCSVCLGTACHVRGAPRVEEEFEKQLHVAAGQTTRDKEFTLETVNCLGACALGPVVVVDGRYFSGVNTPKVKQIIEQARSGLDEMDVRTDRRIFPLAVNCPRCNRTLMDAAYRIDGTPSIRVAMTLSGKQRGWLRLSALYGSYNFESNQSIPRDIVVKFYCPHCHSDMTGWAWCPECNAPMATMIVHGGGILQVCSRRGCKGHMLDVC